MKRNIVYVLACLCMGSGLWADERIWAGAAGANWTNENAWTVGGIPTNAPVSSDIATINNGTTVNLTSAALTDPDRLALVQISGNSRGTLVVGPGAYLPTITNYIATSGTGPNSPGRLIVDGGSVNATGPQNIGADSPNNPAQLDVINGGNYTNASFLRVYGGLLVSNSTFTSLNTTYLHGSTFTSSFEIVDSTVNLRAFAIGRDINNSNGKSLRNVLKMRSGTLSVNGDLEVGHTGNFGLVITGMVEQTGGTIFLGSGNTMRLPVNSSTYASAVGIYNLSGGLLVLQNVNDCLFLGGRDSGAQGFFNVTDGIFTNKGGVQVGTQTNGYGSFSVSGGYAQIERSFQVGSVGGSRGNVDLSNGTLKLGSGSTLYVGNASNAVGRVTINSGLLDATGRTFNIGSYPFGNGTFVQTGGVITNGPVTVGPTSNAVSTLIVSNGLWTSSSGFTLANVLGSTASMEVAGGAIYSFGEFYVGHGSAGKGGIATFTMTGGKITTTYRFIVGSYGIGYATISGGEIEALRNPVTGGTDQSLEVGRDPNTYGQLTMTGGTLKGTNELVIARDTGSTGMVYVAGGDLYVNAIRRGNGLSGFYLAGGTLHPYNTDTIFSFNASLTNDIGFGVTDTEFGFNPVDKDGVTRAMTVVGTFNGVGGLAKRGVGTVTVGGTLTYTGPTVAEAGTLTLSNSVSSLASGVIDVWSNAVLDVSSRVSPFPVATGQLLKGAGSVVGNISMVTGSQISGGSTNVAGILTINGNLTLNDNAEVLFNMIGGSYSSIHVTGDVTLPAHPKLTVNGPADLAAEGAPILTWGGTLSVSGTLWTVTGENDPIVVLDTTTKTLKLSYLKGTILLVR